MQNLQDILTSYIGRQREALLPVLWDAQTRFGHISAESVHEISHVLRVPTTEIYGVIEFYSLFHKEPTAERIIRVCTDPSCGLANADGLIETLCAKVGVHHDEISADGKFQIQHTTCLGLCEHAPTALISQREVGEFAIGNIQDPLALLDAQTGDDYGMVVESDLNILLASNSSNLDYSSLAHALQNLSQAEVIKLVEDSGLIGRGGAAFPTGMKWKFTRGAEGSPKYVVANADESEPGTFKDRVLMEMQPHLLLEGIMLCGYAIGAEKGYIFIRGEYPYAQAQLQQAIDAAQSAGWLGENIQESGFNFDIEIRRGAGAYICGEETALFEAIEGKRGFPRIKPPYPTTHGLFYKPTVVNNVETLCVVPSIIEHGAEWFRGFGTEKSAGPKLISVSGHVNRPGVYEISPGITLRETLERHCQGIQGELQAILMGGAAGTFLTLEDIDVKLTFEDLRDIGSTFGSGAIMVFNQTTDLNDVLVRLARFFQHESCGKCFPCQLGTQRQLEILEKGAHNGDVIRLQDVGWTMTEASLCGLGQTAASAVLSAIDKFPHLFE